MGKDTYRGPLEQVDACCWRIPKRYKQGMCVDGLIFASAKLMEQLKLDQAPEQVANVAFLPGIQAASLAMPDIHWGYGFPIGGVCATDPDEGGVITPGGIGFDINCGVRLMRSNLYYQDVKPRLRQLVESLFRNVPTGVGRSGRYKFDKKELQHLLGEGVGYLLLQAVDNDDYPLMQALFLLITVAVLLAILVSDIAVAILDTATAGSTARPRWICHRPAPIAPGRKPRRRRSWKIWPA